VAVQSPRAAQYSTRLTHARARDRSTGDVSFEATRMGALFSSCADEPKGKPPKARPKPHQARPRGARGDLFDVSSPDVIDMGAPGAEKAAVSSAANGGADLSTLPLKTFTASAPKRVRPFPPRADPRIPSPLERGSDRQSSDVFSGRLKDQAGSPP